MVLEHFQSNRIHPAPEHVAASKRCLGGPVEFLNPVGLKTL